MRSLACSTPERLRDLVHQNTLLCLVWILVGCGEEVQGPTEDPILIRLVDISVSKVFLALHIPITSTIDSVVLLRDNAPVQSYHPTAIDTVVTDSGLTEGSTYTYRIEAIGPLSAKSVSNSLTVETLIRSSNQIVWETYFLGDGNLSLLNDVEIISDSNIWAVGELYLRDSTGAFDPTTYNVALWDGTAWRLERVFFPICGSEGVEVGSLPFPCHSIHAFGENEVWMTEGANVVQWDGTEYGRMCLPPGLLAGGLREIWGGQSKNLYGVGTYGTIVTTRSGVWQAIESGTSTLINDVWGYVNPTSQEEEAVCAVSSFFVPGDQKVLRIQGLEADSVPWNTGRNVNTVWTNKGFPLIAGGDGLFENSSGQWVEIDLGHPGTINCIRGNSLADIFVAGAGGIVAHFDGLEWELHDNIYPAHYFSVAVNEYLVVAVGSDFNRGVVTIGRRP